MLEIKTYLKKKGIIRSLENINENSAQYFVCFDSEEKLCYIEDFDYIEGALVICSNGEYILDFRCWDLVDQLWSYLLHAIYKMLTEKKEVKFNFPDQPLEFGMRMVSNHTILLSVKEKKHIVDKREFLTSVLEGAEQFFLMISKCGDREMASQCESELRVVKEIQDKILIF